MDINKLIEKVAKIRPDSDTTMLRLAYNIATKKHEGQVRVSGSPYLTHALEVADILANLHLDITTLAAAILHDVVEDTNVTIDEIKENLGEEIAHLVEGVTKISAIQFKTSEQRQAENFRKMFLAMAKDIRVILIKLADRTHNMRTLEFLSSEKQMRIAKETLDIYAPLANRLGMAKIKNELEDLCFKYIFTEEYEKIKKKIDEKFYEREKFVEHIIDEIEATLIKVKIKGVVTGRPKHLYGIFRKLKSSNKNFDEIYDIIGLRVITNSIKDCYGILGLIHTQWPPMPGRFKDYIATPKSNMYQSLHTTIISPFGEPIEIQIRTKEMHRIAEEGIAAHWKYKEGEKFDEKLNKNILWLRQLIEWQNELRNPHEFLDALKVDLFKNEVYVFTPKGAVKELQEGSTPVDFAYSIHTDIGHRCIGAKINNKLVPLKYKLKNGDIIEISTSDNHHPSRDWLNFVKTSKAKSKIRQWIKQQEYHESVISGEKIITSEVRKEIKHFHLDISIESKLKEIKKYLPELGFDNIEELYANISYNRGIISLVNSKLFPERRKFTDTKKVQKHTSDNHNISKIKIDGFDKNTMIKLAKCCTPVPYDDIMGFLTRGRGITIHRANCSNAKSLQQEEHRIVEAKWSKKALGNFEAALKVRAYNRSNLLKDILSIIAETNITINSASAKAIDDKIAVCSFLIEIANIKQMEDIIKQISNVKSVIKVYRDESIA